MKLIVALIDFSDVTSDLVTLAGNIARAMNSRLILLHVAMPDAELVKGREREDVSRQGIARELRHHHRDLEILELELKKLGVDALALMVRGDSSRGSPVRKIVEEVDRLAPDVVVIGSHGRRKLYQMLVGSVTDALVRKVRRPVLLVPSQVQRGSDPDVGHARAGQ